MQKINFQDLPSTTTPISAANLNLLQTNVETAFNLKADSTTLTNYINGTESMGNIVVDSIRSKNMFNKNNALIKKFVNKETGDIADSDDWSATDFMEVEPNTSYVFSGVNNSLSSIAGTAFYNSSKVFISGIDSTTYNFTTPANAKYVRISLNTETPTQVQVEKGNTATDYAPYQNLDGLENYSTDEIKIGTWIDGKPLYRKIYTISNPQNSNTNYVNLASLNIATVVNLKGFYSTSFGTFSIPFYDSENNYSVMFVNDNNQLRGRIVTSSNITDTKVIIEYTKTTD